jgi:uncharacterized membrane protein YukC
MKRKLRIYQEDVKTRHTAHWDWDYFTWEEIEQQLKEAGVGEIKEIRKNGKTRKIRRSTYGIGFGVGLLIAAVLVLVAIIREPLPCIMCDRKINSADAWK